MGCPTTYEGKTAEWTKGKLTKLSSGTMATGVSNYTYTYNAYGQRVGKAYSYLPGKSTVMQVGQLTKSNCVYFYDYAGRLIAQETMNTYYQMGESSEKIVFLYDESGIIGMVRTDNGVASTYYFQRNLLGDVVAIYNTSGNMLAKYLYDAFGNCTISSETTNLVVAYANPIRYRGYYYDDDTGLYYLQSRYYDPEIGRFLNADIYTSTGQGVLGNNMFAYCGNNPISRSDPTGNAFVQVAYNFDGLSNSMFLTLGGGGGGGIGCSALGYIAIDIFIHDPDVQEIVQTAKDITEAESVGDVIEVVKNIAKNELVQDISAPKKIKSGIREMIKGFELVLFPMPSYIDEIKGAAYVAHGFSKVVYGIGELFNWLEDDK